MLQQRTDLSILDIVYWLPLMVMRICLSYTLISPTSSPPHYPVMYLYHISWLIWSQRSYCSDFQILFTLEVNSLSQQCFLLNFSWGSLLSLSLFIFYLVFYGHFLFSEFFRSVDTQWIFFYQWSNIPENLSFQFYYFLGASFWSPLPSCFCLVWLLSNLANGWHLPTLQFWVFWFLDSYLSLLWLSSSNFFKCFLVDLEQVTLLFSCMVSLPVKWEQCLPCFVSAYL